MGLVTSVLGSTIGKFFIDRAYWAAKLSSGKWVCELDERFDLLRGERRPFDWTLDLIDSGDIKKIKQLWLFCPPHDNAPFGSTAHLDILDAGTAFQFKVASISALDPLRIPESQVIGRITDKVGGACQCFIWDDGLRVMNTVPWESNIYHFGSWREGIAPIQSLSHVNLGLDLS